MKVFDKVRKKIHKYTTGRKNSAKANLPALVFMGITIASNAFADEKTPENTMVKVKGHALHMMSQGEGEFTVIFESGFGNDLSHWRRVAPAISQKAKVVIYSRAGAGLSEKITTPRSLIESTQALNELIIRAKLKPPFILVGHSYGSHIVRTYAARNPQNIAGLVLVDPANEQFISRLKQLNNIKTEKFLTVYEKMIPKRLQAESKILMAIDEKAALPDFGPLPDVPAAILTSMVQEHPQFIIHSNEGKKIWRELHSKLFSQFTTARHIVTMNSGHNIATQEPELVIESINKVIEQASSLSQKQQISSAMAETMALIEQSDYAAAEKLAFDFLTKSSLNDGQINALGYQYLSTKNAEHNQLILAKIILKYNMMNNQTSANVFDSYGEALLSLNNPQKAKLQFLQAIRLMELKDKEHRTIKGFKANLAKAQLAIESTKK